MAASSPGGKAAADKDTFCRNYKVTSPTRHAKGHTVYRVLAQIFPKTNPDAGFEVLVWRRYNEFKKLHKAISLLHTQLMLPGKCPAFAKAILFGRFEDDVIEERRQSAENLLRFIAQHKPLYSCEAFIAFFRGGKKVNTMKKEMNELPDQVLQPSSSRSSQMCSPKLPQSQSSENMLGGVWKFRQPCDNVSVGSEDEEVDAAAISDDDDANTATTFTDEDSATSPTLSQHCDDLSLFDPLYPAAAAAGDNQVQTDTNDLWLMDAMSACAVLDTHSDEAVSSDSSLDLAALAKESSNTPEETANNQETSPALLPKPQSMPCLSSQVDKQNKNMTLQAPKKTRSSSPVKEKPQKILHPVASAGKLHISPCHVKHDSLLQPAPQQGDYIFQAASWISHAQQAEADGEYQVAFDGFKTGISFLLQGVQGDSDSARRQAVRRKTAKYLVRAESIYHNHLKQRIGDTKRWDVTDKMSPAVDFDPALLWLKGVTSELQNFKVLGVIGKVLLVLDSTSNNTYVMKSLCKGSSVTNIPMIIPSKIEYMVDMFKYYETEHTIFLLLEHASGGQLWAYVAMYLHQQCSEDGADGDEDVFCDGHEQSLRRPRNSSAATVQASPTLSSSSDKSSSHTSYSQLLNEYGCVEYGVKNSNKFGCVQWSSGKNGTSKGDGEEESTDFEKLVAEEVRKPPLTYFSIASNDSDSVQGDNTSMGSAGDRSQPHSRSASREAEAYEMNGCLTVNVSNDSVSSFDVSPSRPSPHQTSKYLKKPFQRSGSADSFPLKKKVSPGQRLFSIDESVLSPVASLERSGSGCENKPRTRTRTLSAVFSKLGLSRASTSLNAAVLLPESCVRIWAAEICLAVSKLHSLGLVLKDLRPENILLGEHGHVLLSYFSQWNCVDVTVCQTAVDNLYTAPELGSMSSVTCACDWWSVGALLFELLTGRTLISCHPSGINAYTTLSIPCQVSSEAASLLTQLLQTNPSERLGGGSRGFEEVRSHPFFAQLDWNSLLARTKQKT